MIVLRGAILTFKARFVTPLTSCMVVYVPEVLNILL